MKVCENMSFGMLSRKRFKVYEVVKNFVDGEFRLLTTWRFMVNFYDKNLKDFSDQNHNLVSSNKELAKVFSSIRGKGLLVEKKKQCTGDMTVSFYRLIKK